MGEGIARKPTIPYPSTSRDRIGEEIGIEECVLHTYRISRKSLNQKKGA